MKIRKLAQGLAVVPLIGAASLLGTQPAVAVDCSTFLSCAVAPATASPPLTDAKAAPGLQAFGAPVPPTVAPVAPLINAAQAPVGNTLAPSMAPITAPVKDTAGTIIPHILSKPAFPPVPVVPIEQAPAEPKPVPAEPQTPVAAASAGTAVQANAEPAAVAPPAAQMHDSGVAGSGLDKSSGNDAQTPRLLDSEPVALHSAQGEMTKYWNSGMFGFGHITPADIPRNVGLAIAYLIVLGTTIGFAIKKAGYSLVARQPSD